MGRAGILFCVVLGACASLEEGQPPGPTGDPPEDVIDGDEVTVGDGEIAVGLTGPFEAMRLGDGSDAIVIAWSDAEDGAIHSFVLADDGDHRELTTVERGGWQGPFAIATGGPAAERRIYMAWVEYDPWSLQLSVLDAQGQLVAPPRSIGAAVSLAGAHVAGTPTGAVVAATWASEGADSSSWDPVTVQVDLAGAVVASRTVAYVPDQTLGVAVAADHNGELGVVYATNESGNRLQRLAADGSTRAAATDLGFHGRNPSSYLGEPWAQVVPLDGSTGHTLLAGLPALGELTDVWGSVADTAIVSAPLAGGAAHLHGTIGEVVAEYDGGSPRFDNNGTPSFTAVSAGDHPGVLLVWQKVLARDPDYQGCLEPPPIHVEVRVERLRAAGTLELVGPSIIVSEWTAATTGTWPPPQPPAAVRIIPSELADQFAVVWNDERGTIHYHWMAPDLLE